MRWKSKSGNGALLVTAPCEAWSWEAFVPKLLVRNLNAQLQLREALLQPGDDEIRRKQ